MSADDMLRPATPREKLRPATPRCVPELLQEYGGATRDALLRYLPAAESRSGLHEILSEYPRRGGKMMRPTLCIATARAFGASLDEALNTAVAIELVHTALLIYDDIQDESLERRGLPTLHALHGLPLALHAGNAMTLLSFQPLLDNRRFLGREGTLQIFQETERMARESAEGQALELGWRRDNRFDLGVADYLEMILKKTCWLAIIFPCRIGALIAGRSDLAIERFIRFGFFLGAAFQIQDDLLNLVGDHSQYGKELAGDLWEGKRTLMLLHFFREAGPDERTRLGELYARPRTRRDASEIRWLRRRMDDCGAIDAARVTAQSLAGAAAHEFSLLFGQLPASRDKHFIEGLVTWVFERT